MVPVHFFRPQCYYEILHKLYRYIHPVIHHSADQITGIDYRRALKNRCTICYVEYC